MSTKIIVSYDGTANEDDAIALGRVFARAGAEVSLAYVRHSPRGRRRPRERSPRPRRRSCSTAASSCSATPTPHRHVVTDRSTPEGLRALAEREGADVIVFCSDSHTAKGHVAIGNSAERLLEGGRTAVAIAPVDLAERVDAARRSIVAVGDADGGARETAESLAGGARRDGRARSPTTRPTCWCIDSRAGGRAGRVSLSSSAAHLIEIATCPVLVLPRGVELAFAGAAAGVAGLARAGESAAPRRAPARPQRWLRRRARASGSGRAPPAKSSAPPTR